MKRIYIVTGAAGHLGSTIIRYLKDIDCIIRALILPIESGVDDDKTTYYRGDVTDTNTLNQIFSNTEDNEVIVIHCAGIVSVDSKVSPLIYNVNVNGTRNIITQCKLYKVKRLLYISSVHAIKELKKPNIISEVSSFSPDEVVGFYAKTKAEATQLCLDASKDGLDTVIVHPSGILGPYDSGNNHIVQMISYYINGRLKGGIIGGYDFVDVRDVAKACISACDKGINGECYILSNTYITVRQILNYVDLFLERKKNICYFSIKFVLSLAPIFEWVAKRKLTKPLFTKYSIYTLDSNSNFSHDKASTYLDFFPRHIKETVQDTVKYLKGEEVSL